MPRFKLSHIELLFHVEGAQNSLCFENSPRFSQGYSGTEQMELTTLSLYSLPWAPPRFCRPINQVSGDQAQEMSLIDSISVWKAQVWNGSQIHLVSFTEVSVPFKNPLSSLPEKEKKLLCLIHFIT